MLKGLCIAPLSETYVGNWEKNKESDNIHLPTSFNFNNTI